MRRPVAEVRRKPMLAFRLGAKFQELLLPQKLQGQGRSDGIGELLSRDGLEILGNAAEEQCMTGLIEFTELLDRLRRRGGVGVLQIVDVALKKGIAGEQFDHAKRVAANGDDIHAAVPVTLNYFQNFRLAS